ncbi:MAG: GNAT family N-acetyltransferase, partial [Bacteroidaceae bacterium]|nr:GNAT family N-acetyltransferase [Bacteroidaceae bacterium]
MNDFITPPNHINFRAKRLFGEMGRIADGAIAYIDLDGGGPAEPHTHSHNHLFIVTEGEAKILLGDKEIIVKKDEAFLVEGKIPHSVWNNSDGMTKMIGITVVPTGEMCLRPFMPSDAAKIMSWNKDKRAFRLWSADRFGDFPAEPSELTAQFDDDRKIPLVAMADNEVVGFIMMRYPTDDNSLIRLGFVIIDDSKRGKGYGSKMLRLAIDHARNELGAKRISLGVFC